jgi:hypothetical protein
MKNEKQKCNNMKKTDRRERNKDIRQGGEKENRKRRERKRKILKLSS